MDLDDARAVLAAGPVCDACLGRVFAARSHGLGNDERGKGLRVAVALAADEPFEPTPPSACWVCEGVSGRYEELADRCVAAVDGVEFDTYQVGTRLPPLYEENDALLRADAGLPEGAGESLKRDCNREVGIRVGRRTGAAVDFERPDVQFTLDLEADEVEARVNSAFVYGRYRKLERGIPQTEWPCRECDGSGRSGGRACEHCEGTGYLYEDSVEELVAPVVEDVLGGVGATFHGAGREDVDARMLGTGRPFVVEVHEPRRRHPDCERLAADVNAFAEGRVEVEGLRPATHRMVERVKEHPASKRYRAEVRFGADVSPGDLAGAVEALSGATVEQYTPERVDHRRAGKVRERTVYDAAADLEAPRTATVEIHGEGGLYVKELVSGDGDRTEPSLAGLLGVEATVAALDVLAVEGEAEPFEREAFFRDGTGNAHEDPQADDGETTAGAGDAAAAVDGADASEDSVDASEDSADATDDTVDASDDTVDATDHTADADAGPDAPG